MGCILSFCTATKEVQLDEPKRNDIKGEQGQKKLKDPDILPLLSSAATLAFQSIDIESSGSSSDIDVDALNQSYSEEESIGENDEETVTKVIKPNE